MPVYKNDKTGKYYASFYYTDWQGNRRKKKKEGFTLSRDAKAYEADFLARLASDCTITFSVLFEYHKEYIASRLKASSCYSKIQKCNKYILPYFSNTPIKDITPVMVHQWQNKLVAGGYKPSTLYDICSVFSSILNFGVKYYGLKENPARIAGRIGTLKQTAFQFWTLAEFNQFIQGFETHKHYNVANAKGAMYHLIFSLLFYSGMRIGELLALTVDDYDPTAGTVRINKTLARIKKGWTIQAPKTNKSNRTITIPAKVCALLDKYINTLYLPDGTERLFSINNHSSVSSVFSAMTEYTGVKHIRVHDLRHSHASLLVEMGFNPLAISERLGHEDIEITLNRYSHLYPNKAKEIAEQLNDI